MSFTNFIRTHLFYRQHPDTALRYLPIIELLKKEKLINASIVEIGSGSYGIAPYLKRKVTGVDLSFEEPEFSLLTQVKGSATDIPFPDNSFDVVLLSDVVEHLPQGIRSKSLNEAVRVADKIVIISGPFGMKAAEQDRELAEYSQKKLGSMHHFFEDHLKNGLPDTDEMRDLLKDNKKVKSVVVVGSYLNLSVRKLLMKLFITNNKFVYYFYLKGMMFFVPVLKLLNMHPCYRTVMMIKVK